MAYIIWSEFFSVNIPYIDQQHKKLFDIINEFHNAVKSGQTKEKVFQTLHQLTMYCEKHFADEEMMLKTAGYNDTEFSHHQVYHEKLLADIFIFAESLEKNDADILLKLETFLNGWMISHILIQDKKYEHHFKKTNI